MSFADTAANVKVATAKNKIDRLLLSVPEDEAEALLQLLHNKNLSSERLAKIIRSEATGDVEGTVFDLSVSAVKRWRVTNIDDEVNGL